MPGDYKVGYGKPPEHTRFHKGRSGNPNGRPQDSRGLATDLKEELAERIQVREGPSTQRLSKQRVVVKRLVEKALKGDAGSIRDLLHLALRLEDPVAEPEAAAPISLEEQEVLLELERRLLRRGSESPASDPSSPEET